MAGAEGLEPSTKVLETHVLPLHHAPMFSRTGFIIQEIRSFVNTQVSILLLLFASPVRIRVISDPAPVRENRIILTDAHVFVSQFKICSIVRWRATRYNAVSRGLCRFEFRRNTRCP